MMSKEELLKTQQSVLQSAVDVNRGEIHTWEGYVRAYPESEPGKQWRTHVASLHKKQYALSKLLKSVEQEIRWEADKLRLMKEVSAIAQEQGEYE